MAAEVGTVPPIALGHSKELVYSVDFRQVRDYRSIERGEPDLQPAANCKEKEARCKYVQRGSLLDHVVYFCALSVASYAGVLARIYLGDLAQWDGIPLFPSFYAEFVGTAIMGFIISHKKLLDAGGHKALYHAIATGLCGSITTFSSWNSEAAIVLLQLERAPPNNAERIIGWFTTLLVGVGMPVAALHFGKHIAHLSPLSDYKNEGEEPFRNVCMTVEKIAIIVAWCCCTPLVIALPYLYQKYDLMFSLIFSFVGTYIRWHLAPLNSLLANFKLGTFIVNVLGSWILGATLVLADHFADQLDQLETSILNGVTTGFCGCLTTVSTFAVELTILRPTGSYVYGLCSILLAQAGLVVIRGSYKWTR